MLQGVKRELFRKPRGGRSPWVCLLIGGVEIAIGLFFHSPGEGQLPRLFFVAIGLMFVFWGAAELQHKDRTTLAAWLRVGQYTASVCSMILLIAHLSSRAS